MVHTIRCVFAHAVQRITATAHPVRPVLWLTAHAEDPCTAKPCGAGLAPSTCRLGFLCTPSLPSLRRPPLPPAGRRDGPQTIHALGLATRHPGGVFLRLPAVQRGRCKKRERECCRGVVLPSSEITGCLSWLKLIVDKYSKHKKKTHRHSNVTVPTHPLLHSTAQDIPREKSR